MKDGGITMRNLCDNCDNFDCEGCKDVHTGERRNFEPDECYVKLQKAIDAIEYHISNCCEDGDCSGLHEILEELR